MQKIVVLLAVSLLLAFLIDYRDKALSYGLKKRRDRFFTFCLILLLAVYCGLRTKCNDTETYLHIFSQIPNLSDYVREPYNFAHGVGFGFLTSAMKTIGFSPQDYLMCYACITVLSYVLFVRRHAVSMTFCVFLMFATGFYTFTFAAIKQCMATAMALWAVTAALKRKWLRYAFFLVLAALFHPYSIIYLFVPLMMFKPWTWRTWFYMALFVAAGFGLESLIGTVIDVTTLIGADYTEPELLGAGVNIFRVAVSFVPMVLSIFYRKELFSNSGRTENLMFNLSVVHAMIMFVGLFGTANYFARLANYFIPAVVVVLPWMLSKIKGNDRRWLKIACAVCYLGYFYYENAIARPFDSYFVRMTLWEYLSTLI